MQRTILAVIASCVAISAQPQQVQPSGRSGTLARDPGPRAGSAAAGGPIAGATAYELAYFSAGMAQFLQVDSVRGPLAGQAATQNTGLGLGPRFNSDSCVSCHSQPAAGGSSPASSSPQATGSNPQATVGSKNGGTNQVPAFIRADGPVREARFKRNPDGSRDGGVHALFVISGRLDAVGCSIAQPDFATAAATGNLALRIPTPVFGGGLIEAIPDAAILANKASSAAAKQTAGIAGHENRSGNDGTITRFGWKAQNPSLAVFSGEAYNVEIGTTNDLFPTERDSTAGCQFNAVPEDHTNLGGGTASDTNSDIVRFTAFMRLLAPPSPAPDTTAIVAGRQVFGTIGCALCHTPVLHTGTSNVAALSDKDVGLYSDLLVHAMGRGLEDDIVQGLAGPSEFRTAPLWGLGQRIFFLHDGRARDLMQAIEAHSGDGSEANVVIRRYEGLSVGDKNNLLQFLRSL